MYTAHERPLTGSTCLGPPIFDCVEVRQGSAVHVATSKEVERINKAAQFVQSFAAKLPENGHPEPPFSAGSSTALTCYSSYQDWVQLLFANADKWLDEQRKYLEAYHQKNGSKVPSVLIKCVCSIPRTVFQT